MLNNNLNGTNISEEIINFTKKFCSVHQPKLILILHVIGAIVLVPMVPMTLVRALRERFDAHKLLARWTWPLWMYVSVSGVVVYVMAIHIYPYSG